MATTPKTVRTYALDGTKKDFTIPFEYLARKFVVVTLIGATRRELILNTEYRFTTNTTITTTKAWGPADNFDLIEIRRLTSATERLVDFADGSILRAYDLNISQVQSLHIAEEARDLTADTIGVNNDGDLDARARKIVNLADGVNDGDAVNMRQQRQWAGSALNSANASAASAQASEASRQASLAQAQASAASAGQSSTYATNSQNSASNSQTSRLASEAARDASITARDLSQAWASKAEDQVVASGLYSSYHYSRKSAASASASLTSANNSANSASFSTTEANRATTQADRAKTEADKLGNMNALGGAIREVNTTGKKVEINTGWEWNSDVIAVDGFRSRSSSSIDFNAQLNGRLGASFTGSLSVGGTTSLQNTTVAGLTVNTGAQFKNGNVQVFAPKASDNAHVWFYNPDGATRGILYAGTDKTVRMQAGEVVCAAFSPDGGTTLNNISAGNVTARGAAYTQGGIENNGRVASYRNGVGANASMYTNCHFMAQTDDGTAPAYGFHRGGSYALALYLSGNSLFMMDSAGLNREVLNNTNLGSWMVSMGEQGVGSYAFCRSSVTATYGVDVAGGNLTYGSTGANGGSVPGTWRSRGWAGGGNHTLFQRIA
ncbi:tail fiber protein [Pseudomonas phage phiPsa17]|uniref:Tail fiber protein n=1 Tax=Pseudomonas phage phiPsa17 TaxID=1629654 RepID=A0A0G2T4R5_9CAUD|nr:tail fiber protein [Pseudomonas phage phiPsa17]AKG94385.1 tail fiber protein [Pseudomonas phage phiPsa17]